MRDAFCVRRACARCSAARTPKLDLVPHARGGLRLRYRLMGVIGIPLGELGRIALYRDTVQGREILVAEQNGVRVLLGERIDEALASMPPGEAWRARLGGYAIADLDGDDPAVAGFGLRLEDGVLTFELASADDPGSRLGHALGAVSDDEAVILGVGSGLGESVRVVRDPVAGEERLRYSGYVLERTGP